MTNRSALSLTLATLTATLPLPGCGGGGARPNVVLIVVDSLRADALGSYGVVVEPTPSPAMDRLAAEGVRFERAVAPASWNLPSVSSLVTSSPPWVHGQGAPVSGAAEIATLAETFDAAGYRTGAFTEMAWPLLQRGFEAFQNTAFGHTFGDPEANSAERTFGAAIDWIQEDDATPFFALVHTYEVHSYFLGKPGHHEAARAALPDYDGPFRDWAIRDLSQPAGPQVIEALVRANAADLEYVRALYRAAITEVDGQVLRLVGRLKEAGLDDGTIVVLTSSNGEGFRPDLGRVHHGGRLHHDVLHVPLILRWPGHLEPTVEKALVPTLDVAPTLLALAGLPGEPRFAGQPLLAPETGLFSSFRGPRFRISKLEKRDLVAQEAVFRTLATGEREPATSPQLALYQDWVVLIDDGDVAELYDLKDDPGQERNLADEYADGVNRLREKVHRIAERGATAGAGDDAEQMEQLRSLGYVQ